MISINEHSSIKIEDNKTGIIYFDPFHIRDELHDADVIFITHDHYDHFSPEDVNKVANEMTKFVCPFSCLKSLVSAGLPEKLITCLNPDEKCAIEAKNGQFINVNAIHSYNVGKPFHPKRNNWLGYVITISNEEGKDISYYIPGDMDENEDALRVKCDVLFVPIGGTYTMNAADAAKFTNKICPKLAIPMHYGSIAGARVKGEDFSKLVDSEIEVKILI